MAFDVGQLFEKFNTWLLYEFKTIRDTFYLIPQISLLQPHLVTLKDQRLNQKY